MAKGNLLLGTAYNKLGDIVLMRKDGWQMSRVRVRKISNPKTANQAVNRALLSTIGTAYKYMRYIVDHSFQGLSKPVLNQRQFQKLSQGIARATGSVSVSGTDEGFNFNFKGEHVLRPNPWPLSRGTLPNIPLVALKSNETNRLNGIAPSGEIANYIAAGVTYQAFCNAFNVAAGTQLTFCVITDDTFTGVPSGNNVPYAYGNFHFARVILMPDDGDMTKAMFEAAGDFLVIANANSRNEGDIQFKAATKAIVVSGQEYPLAAGVITSSYSGQWLRSNTDMIVSSGYESSNTMSEVYGSYMYDEGTPYSDYYLNQSGAQDDNAGDSSAPAYVPAPVISGDLTFSDTATATISAVSGAAIYYTTNGSTPTVESTRYTSSLTLEITTTVKAIAVKGGVVSDVATQVFTKNGGGFEG